MEENLPFPLWILWIMCMLHFLCWVQQNKFTNRSKLTREMLLKKLFYIWWNFVTSLVKTIKSTFFTNKQKIPAASVRNYNVASFKKQRKEAVALWYSLVMLLYLLSFTLCCMPLDQFCFVKFFITLSWHSLQLPVNKGEENS